MLIVIASLEPRELGKFKHQNFTAKSRKEINCFFIHPLTFKLFSLFGRILCAHAERK
jgi:hypothetical protein